MHLFVSLPQLLKYSRDCVSTGVHFREHRQHSERHSAHATGNAFTYQCHPHWFSYRRFVGNVRLHAICNLHEPIYAVFSRGAVDLWLELVCHVSFDIRTDLSYHLNLAHCDIGCVALHCGWLSTEKSNLVWYDQHPTSNHKFLHRLPYVRHSTVPVVQHKTTC